MDETQRFGRFEVRPAERQLLIDGHAAPIGARAFDLLQALIEGHDRVVSKSELLDIVWPGVFVEENNLQVQVSSLRKLLGPNTIATIPGRGYRFVVPSEVAAGPTALNPPEPAADSADSAGNLPSHTPPLIGRDVALRELLTSIDEHALVTVVGAGGIGKTRLALTAALALRGRFRDGAWWVELAPLRDPELLPQAVAQALRITLDSQGSPGTEQQQLVGVLRSQRMLLVLDNCEHVVDAVSRLAQAIGSQAPGVHMLATSQELLGVSNERVFPLDPLSVPAAGEAPDVETHGAVALFVERAQNANPRFSLAAENAIAVAEICRRLDGLPLAIELAAARVRLLGVEGVRERLGQRFKVLVGGARTALRRHQALRTTIEWSHALLKDDEQAVLRRLGVFVNGFSLELAQSVAAGERPDEWAVLDALGTLVDKSLLAVDAGEPLRYRLLETTRAYALERLAEHGETARCQQRHAHALRDVFARTDDERYGDGGTLDMASLMRRLVPELDNWRAAFDWATSSDPATAVALAGSGALVLRHLGLREEALDRMLPLRRLVDDEAHRSHAAAFWLRLSIVGDNHRLTRDVLLDAAARARRLYGEVGSRRRLLMALYTQAWSLNMVGEFSAAEALLPEIIGLERVGDPVWLRCHRLSVQASVYLHRNRFEESASVLAEQMSLLLQAPGEHDSLAICQHNLSEALNCLQRHEEAIVLARSALERTDGIRGSLLVPILCSLTALGRLDDAWRTLREALPLWRRDAVLLDLCCDIAALFAVSGRHADAARVDGAAIAHLRRVDAPLVAPGKLSRARMFRAFEAARVSPADIERWQHEGEALDEVQVAALCEMVAASP